jgi:CheY-like chemotaxis protein
LACLDQRPTGGPVYPPDGAREARHIAKKSRYTFRMSAKRALIVDDSLSARVVLSRMLQKYGLDVDTAESAEAAIAYLAEHRPDVVFMDHLMPGMDGFQALQAIKNNPRTATIPIMMYTSQQGELYVGQARALGAVGVLPKLVKPVDVSKILYQLHLLPERRDATPSSFVAVNAPPVVVQEARTQYAKPAAPPSPPALPADWRPQLESALRNHDADLRRFVVGSLDTFAHRVIGDIRTQITEVPALQQLPPPAARPPYLWIGVVLLVLAMGLTLALLHQRALEANRVSTARVQELQRANTALTAEIKQLQELEALHARATLQASTLLGGSVAVATASTGTAPMVELVPYGETPLAFGRHEALRELLADLESRSFQGVVEVRTYSGRFCVVGNTNEGYALAPDDLPASRCDVIGNPFQDSMSVAQRQSLAFANLASSVRQRSAGALSVAVLDPILDVSGEYPREGEAVTAGRWNEIAARHNRVEFAVVAGAQN